MTYASLLLLVPLALLGSGCVERELVVLTEPSGARVYVDGVDRGVTTEEGLRVPFEYYGTREVVVRLAGHTPVQRMVEVVAPWWQTFPIGLGPDVLWPGTVLDEHPVSVALTRRDPPPPAREFEQRARAAKEQ